MLERHRCVQSSSLRACRRRRRRAVGDVARNNLLFKHSVTVSLSVSLSLTRATRDLV